MNEPERDINKTLKIQLVRKIGPFPPYSPTLLLKIKPIPPFALLFGQILFLCSEESSLCLSLSLCLHADSSH